MILPILAAATVLLQFALVTIGVREFGAEDWGNYSALLTIGSAPVVIMSGITQSWLYALRRVPHGNNDHWLEICRDHHTAVAIWIFCGAVFSAFVLTVKFHEASLNLVILVCAQITISLIALSRIPVIEVGGSISAAVLLPFIGAVTRIVAVLIAQFGGVLDSIEDFLVAVIIGGAIELLVSRSAFRKALDSKRGQGIRVRESSILSAQSSLRLPVILTVALVACSTQADRWWVASYFAGEQFTAFGFGLQLSAAGLVVIYPLAKSYLHFYSLIESGELSNPTVLRRVVVLDMVFGVCAIVAAICFLSLYPRLSVIWSGDANIGRVAEKFAPSFALAVGLNIIALPAYHRLMLAGRDRVVTFCGICGICFSTLIGILPPIVNLGGALIGWATSSLLLVVFASKSRTDWTRICIVVAVIAALACIDVLMEFPSI